MVDGNPKLLGGNNLTNMLSCLALGSTCLDEEDIAILNNVFFTLGHDLSSCLYSCFVTKLLKSVVVENNRLNESFLEI